MRILLLVVVAALAVPASGASAATRTCTHVSRGFRACTTFGERGERSAIYRRAGGTWTKVAGEVPQRRGWWRRVVASPDRRTLLAQWSGECEAQSTYLVSPRDGTARPIFRGHESEVVGWTRDGDALVRLREGIWHGRTRLYAPGIYCVDPRTLAVRRLRAERARPGC